MNQEPTTAFAVLDFIHKMKGIEIIQTDPFNAKVDVLVTDENGVTHKYTVSERSYLNSDNMSVLIKDHTDGNTRVMRWYRSSKNYPDTMDKVNESFFTEDIHQILKLLRII